MSVIALRYYGFASLQAEEQPLPDWPLARRMTNMQRVMLKVLAQWQQAAPTVAAQLLTSERAPLFTASHYGELTTLVSLEQQLWQREIAVSPTAFQNSLPNTAGGYAAIYHRLTQPQQGISCGHLSLDTMLLSAAQSLISGYASSVVCLSGTEAICCAPMHAAEAECIVLSLVPEWEGWILRQIRSAYGLRHNDFSPSTIWDCEAPIHVAQLRLDQWAQTDQQRIAIDLETDAILSQWSYNLHA